MLERATFVADAALVWDELVRRHRPPWYEVRPQRYELDAAFEMYRRAASTQLDALVLGSDKIRSDLPLLTNFGTTAVTSAWDRPEHGPAASSERGSILAERNWWPLLNYAWVLGGIHGQAFFHYGKPPGEPPAQSDLWDNGQRRPRVLGQELLLLQLGGYRLVDVDENLRRKLGYTFMPVERSSLRISHCVRHVSASFRAKQATLASIRRLLDEPVDPGELGRSTASTGSQR